MAAATVMKYELATQLIQQAPQLISNLTSKFDQYVPAPIRSATGISPQALTDQVVQIAGRAGDLAYNSVLPQIHGLADIVVPLKTKVDQLPAVLGRAVGLIVDAKLAQRGGGYTPQTGGGPRADIPKDTQDMINAAEETLQLQAGGGESQPPTQILGPAKIPPSVDPTSTVYQQQEQQQQQQQGGNRSTKRPQTRRRRRVGKRKGVATRARK